jgi:transposase-like protein
MPPSSNSDRVVFWRNLIAQRQSSQLTVRQLCEQAGVSPASFFDWQRRLRAADQAARSEVTPALVPVRVVEDRLAQIIAELPSVLRVRRPKLFEAADRGRTRRKMKCGLHLRKPSERLSSCRTFHIFHRIDWVTTVSRTCPKTFLELGPTIDA